jgi:hypothetical protein
MADQAGLESGNLKGDQQLVDECNELARKFYLAHGNQVDEGYRFDRATHPQEQSMWNLAVIAYDFIDGTDIEDAISNLE